MELIEFKQAIPEEKHQFDTYSKMFYDFVTKLDYAWRLAGFSKSPILELGLALQGMAIYSNILGYGHIEKQSHK